MLSISDVWFSDELRNKNKKQTIWLWGVGGGIPVFIFDHQLSRHLTSVVGT